MERLRRSYESVSIAKTEDGHAILLDAVPAKTPAGAPLIVSTGALAESLAFEWSGTQEFVDFEEMRLTRLAFSAIDFGTARRGRWAEDILAFARADLLCYRAPAPLALTLRQAKIWEPYLAWARETLGAALSSTQGVAAVEQPAEAIAAIRRRVSSFDAWTLVGVRCAAELSGSAILALALAGGDFSADAIFEAAHLDERFQSERWGLDPAAAAREAAIRRDFDAAARWLELVAR